MTYDNLPQAPAGEFVMFSSTDGKVKIECRFESDTIWLSQAMICELYGKAKGTISEHIKNIFTEGEFAEDSVVRFYRTTAAELTSQWVNTSLSNMGLTSFKGAHDNFGALVEWQRKEPR